MNSKIVLTTFGLAVLAATPALAERHVHRTASAPYASVNEPAVLEGHRVNGTDPDAQIRFELGRDSSTHTSTN
jgi:hypothetical protein